MKTSCVFWTNDLRVSDICSIDIHVAAMPSTVLSRAEYTADVENESCSSEAPAADPAMTQSPVMLTSVPGHSI